MPTRKDWRHKAWMWIIGIALPKERNYPLRKRKMPKLKNTKPAAGMKLHKVIATGGTPADFVRLNKKKK